MVEMVTFYSNLYKSKNVSKDGINQYLENMVVTETIKICLINSLHTWNVPKPSFKLKITNLQVWMGYPANFKIVSGLKLVHYFIRFLKKSLNKTS